jgi:7-cyano-7-deazaguanine reductase
MTSNHPTLLGVSVKQPVEHIQALPLHDAHKMKTVTFNITEFTAVCPVTNQPDYYDISIEINPGDFSIESKSLKLWLWQYRDKGIFCETITQEVLDEVVSIIRPVAATVSVTQASRGGIQVCSVASYFFGK